MTTFGPNPPSLINLKVLTVMDTFNHKKNSYFICALFLLLPFTSLAQSADTTTLARKNRYYSGNISYFSAVLVNYELPLGSKVLEISNRAMTLNGYARFAGGMGYDLGEDWAGPGIGAAFSVITGKGDNHMEFSFGMLPTLNIINSNIFTVFVVPIVDLGYRYQKPTGGFIFRAYIANIGIGMSFGQSF